MGRSRNQHSKVHRARQGWTPDILAAATVARHFIAPLSLKKGEKVVAVAVDLDIIDLLEIEEEM